MTTSCLLTYMELKVTNPGEINRWTDQKRKKTKTVREIARKYVIVHQILNIAHYILYD